MRTAFATWRLARARPHFGAFLRNCVQIDPVGQVSVAPRTEAPRTGNPDIGPFITEDREAFVSCPVISDHYDDGCFVFGIRDNDRLLCAFRPFIASNLNVAFGSDSARLAGRWAGYQA
jgi:hypothetical protein